MPPLIADPISAGLGVAQTILNPILANQANISAKKRANEVYAQQRQDSLQDWNRQNEYNSPTSQMARLREAGLNPNLVYGNGNSIQPSAQIRAAQTPNAEMHRTEVNPQGVLQQSQNVKLGQAQYDNMKVQNTVLLQEAALKAQQTANLGVQNARSQLELSLATSLKQTSMDMAKQLLVNAGNEGELKVWQRNQAEAQTGFLHNQNLRAEAITSQNIKESLSRMAVNDAHKNQIQQQIESGRLDQEMKKFEIDLNKKGLTKSDPEYLRLLSTLYDKFFK